MSQEEEIEDMVGDVKLTDSQKSVATSNVYSLDFTDSSSDKNNSSGKDTYVIEQDDSDSSSDSDSYPIHKDITVIDLKETNNKDANVQCQVTRTVSRAASTSFNRSIAQEIYTQTSKTIFELARLEGNRESLETQTSYISIIENRTLHTFKSEHSSSSEDRIINILDAESRENILSEDNRLGYSPSSRDSLPELKDDNGNENYSVSEVSDVPRSIDDEIEDLYNKLTASRDQHARDRSEPEKRNRILTPLTEETAIARESLIDLTSESKNVEDSSESDKDVLFTDFAGGRVKALPKEEERELKLPPIQNRSCPSSPQLNFLFSVHPTNKLMKASTLPCVYEATERNVVDRWEIDTKDLASGESALISGRSDTLQSNGSIHLPPIHIEGYIVESKITKAPRPPGAVVDTDRAEDPPHEAISIQDKIQELKMNRNCKTRAVRVDSRSASSRSVSPSSVESPGGKLCDAAEKGCDALCLELLRRLRSSAWYEVSDALGEIPRVLENFWTTISENRTADLIRQVSTQLDSPRTQVARAACNTLACILKNTNYTKKPDFNEAVSLLLTKTGSFSRPVRRAANVALDTIVCGVELSHAAAALCAHGIDHKSSLVRCAAARLLVVVCALGGGGRDVLRARPPSAASARRATLRALAALLDDKTTDARRYAERLYAMLRPLPNFEAYYLTDVEVERATRQMKKYDRCMRSGAARETDKDGR